MNTFNWTRHLSRGLAAAGGLRGHAGRRLQQRPRPQAHLLADAGLGRHLLVPAPGRLQRRRHRLRPVGHGRNRPHGPPAGGLCRPGGDDHAGLCTPHAGGARHAEGRVLHAHAVRAAGHQRHDLGQQLPGRVPGPGTDEPVAVCAGRAAPRPRRVHRSGHEVLRAGCAGQRLPAVRPEHDVRRPPARWRSRACSNASPPARSTRRCWSSASSSWSPAWASSWGRCRSTCGCPTSTRARPRPSPC
jgi:hypothetical protein